MQDHWGVGLAASADDCLELFHVVEVERWNGIAALDCVFEHFLGVDQAKILEADCHDIPQLVVDENRSQRYKIGDGHARIRDKRNPTKMSVQGRPSGRLASGLAPTVGAAQLNLASIGHLDK